MTPLTCLMYALAALVLLAIVHRLALLQCAGRGVSCHVTWHLWVLGQVGIALGAAAILAGRPDFALPLTFGGLVLSYLVRVKPRPEQ